MRGSFPLPPDYQLLAISGLDISKAKTGVSMLLGHFPDKNFSLLCIAGTIVNLVVLPSAVGGIFAATSATAKRSS
jgi:hypothetical protein